MLCLDGFGQIWDGRPFWVGDFNGNGRFDVLFHFPGDGNWWLGSHHGPGGQLDWSNAGTTFPLTKTSMGYPVWVGRFSRSDRAEMLQYLPSELEWRLASHDGREFQWKIVGDTSGFGQVWDGRPFWVGDFTGNGRDDILFYFPGDDNWWLGSCDGDLLHWSFAGKTDGFGHGINDGRPFWVGNFSRADRAEILFYFPGDGNWWLGSHDGNQLRWSWAGNTSGFGQVWDGRPFWIGDFTGNGRADVLFFFPGDKNWWLGSHSGPSGTLMWSLVSTTTHFGNSPVGCPVWIGKFRASDRAEVLFYFPGDDNWWLGSHDGSRFNWTLADNTAGFGHGISDDRPFWTGNFSRPDRAEVLFYYPGDGNWWLGSHDGNRLQWTFAGNTGHPYEFRLRLHVKILIDPEIAIDRMITAMREVYATVCINVELASTERLNLPDLLDIDIGQCNPRFPVTNEQTQLFQNRNNAGPNDIVVYVVRSTDPPANGCASHPAGRPAVVIVSDATLWTLAHEVGHVLGLFHVGDNDRLMTGNGTSNITNPPPDLVAAEARTMHASPLLTRVG